MRLSDILSISAYHGYIPQILLAEFLFTVNLEKKDKIFLRVLLEMPVCLIVMIAIPNILAHIQSGWFCFSIFVISLFFWNSLCRNPFSDVLFCCTGALLTQNLTYNLREVISSFIRVEMNFAQAQLFSWLCIFLTYSICYYCFPRKIKKVELHKEKGYIFLLAVITAVFVYIMQYLFQREGMAGIGIVHMPLVVCCIFGLCMQYHIWAYKSEKEENEKLEYFLQQSNKQYEISRNNIELLNMKAHDLKHYIYKMQKLSENKKDLQELADIVEEYEKTIDCGNRTLDIILTDKVYQCKKNGIDFTYIVDGKILSFMDTSDMISLFANALENAIECEIRMKEKSCCFIALKVFQKGKMISIHLENFCDEKIVLEKGIPVTRKDDRNFHGFGVKSIQYIVKKYSGTMQIGTRNNVYVMNIIFPLEQL